MGFEAKFGKSQPSYEQFADYIKHDQIEISDHPKIIEYIKSINLDDVIRLEGFLHKRRWAASASQGIHDLIKGISQVVANTLIKDFKNKSSEVKHLMGLLGRQQPDVLNSIFSELMQSDPLVAAQADVRLFIDLSNGGVDRNLQLPIALICAKDAADNIPMYLDFFPDLSLQDIILVLTTCVKTDPRILMDEAFIGTVSKKIPKENWPEFINEFRDTILEKIARILSLYHPSNSGHVEPGSFMYEWISYCVEKEPDILFDAIFGSALVQESPIADAWLGQCLVHGRDKEKMVDRLVDSCSSGWTSYKIRKHNFLDIVPPGILSTLVRVLRGIQNREISHLVLCKCAKKMPDYLAEHLPEFELEDQQILEELAKLCAKEDPSNLCKHIANFRIQSQEYLEELAVICVEGNPSSLCASIEQFAIKPVSIRLKIAETAATIDPIALAKEIAHFQLDEPLRFFLAKRCLEHVIYTDEGFLTNYPQFQLQQLPFRLECAKMMLRLFSNRALYLARTVFWDHISSNQVDEAFDLAKEAIIHARRDAILEMGSWLYCTSDPTLLQYQINNPHSRCFLSLDQRKVLAELGSEIDAHATASVIDTFRITNSWSILIKCVQTDPSAIRYTLSLMQWQGWIALFVKALEKIKEPEEIVGPILKLADRWPVSPTYRLSIIAECTRYCPVLVAAHVDALELPHERKFELLQQAVRKCPVGTVAKFGNFSQFTPEQRLELIEGCFKKDPHTTINSPEFFDDCDLETALNFLSRYAETPCARFPIRILMSLFDLIYLNHSRMRTSLYLLAQQFAANTPSELLLNLHYLFLDDPEKIARILQICFQRDPNSVWNFFNGFQNVLSDDQVISLALEWAHTVQSGIALNFQNLGIPKEDQKTILEIALVCAEHDGEETARSFANFQLEGPQVRVQVVRTIARSAPQSLAQLISLENVESEEERYHLAQIAVTSSPKALRGFDHWGIEQQEWIDHLIELSESTFPEEFKKECVCVIKPELIPSLERRKQLAELACQYNPCEAAEAFAHFQIPNKWDQIALVVLMAEQTDQLAHALDKSGIRFDFEEAKALAPLFELTQSGFLSDGLRQIACADPKGPGFQWLVKEELFSATCSILKTRISEKELSVFQDYCYPLIRNFLSHYDLINPAELPVSGNELPFSKLKKIAIAYIGLQVFTESQLSHPLFYHTFKKLLNLRNGPQAIQYLGIMAYKTTDLVLEALAIGVQSSKKKPNQLYGQPLAPLLIPMLMVAKWAGECGHPELTAPLNEIFRSQSIVQKYFKGEMTQAHSLMQMWLQTVNQLEKTKELSSLRKLKLLTQAATGPEGIPALIDCLIYIQTILAEGHALKLDHDFDEFIEDDLICLVTEEVFKDDILQLKEIDDFDQKYAKTLMRLRVPNAWRIYQKKLQEIDDRRLLEHYRQFIVSVLNGTFKEERYQTTSPHIEKIRRCDESLWQKWREGTPSRMIQLRPNMDEAFSFQLFVKEKIRDGHFSNAEGDELFPELRAWAEGNIRAEDVIEKLQKEENPLAKVEERVMQLCINQGLSLETLQKELFEIEGLISDVLTQPFEFLNDLKSLAKTLINPARSEAYQIVNTDDWQDLLLSGTEVEGSCQRISGDPYLNRGLMGYLIDGKIRMIAIKNPETGALEGRALLRILWNATTNSPVLFLDRKYVNKHGISMSRAIDHYAQEVARWLGCSLYKADPIAGKTATKDRIVSLGSVSECEYSDTAARQIVPAVALGIGPGLTDGQYTLSSAYQII